CRRPDSRSNGMQTKTSLTLVYRKGWPRWDAHAITTKSPFVIEVHIMSMPPDNPFEPNPNSRFATQGPPPPKNNVWKWVIGIVAVVGLLGAVVCCGGGYAMFRMGKGMIADQVKQELGANAVIQ